MKKIQFTLDNYELNCWIEFIKHTIAETKFYGYTKTNADMLVLAAIAELLEKLMDTYNPFKTEFKFKISKSQGLALLCHVVAKGNLLPGGFDNITINKIIGLIDKQKNA